MSFGDPHGTLHANAKVGLTPQSSGTFTVEAYDPTAKTLKVKASGTLKYIGWPVSVEADVSW